MAENIRSMRELEELAKMQDTAIRALQEGIGAMHFALTVIRQMIDERGQQMRMQGYDYNPPPIPSYSFNSQPQMMKMSDLNNKHF